MAADRHLGHEGLPPGPGLGSWLKGHLDALDTDPAQAQPVAVVLWTGVAGNSALREKNARWKSIRVDGSGTSETWNFPDTPDALFYPTDWNAGTFDFQITTVAVYPGTKYEDLCASKVFVPGRAR